MKFNKLPSFSKSYKSHPMKNRAGRGRQAFKGGWDKQLEPCVPFFPPIENEPWGGGSLGSNYIMLMLNYIVWVCIAI